MNAFNFKLKFAYAILIFSLFSSLGNSQTITIQLTPSNYNGYNISCLGGRDGSITANVTGGFPPYHYLWSINDTNATISGLSADYYHLVVTDSHSNTKEAEINLHEPEILKVNPTLYVYPNGFNVSQFGACNGSATLSIAGGVAPFTYGWTPGQQAISNPSNLCGRFNSVTVTDANGCRATATMSLSEPDRDDWTMAGNGGVNPATQYMGTNDNNDLVFKTNGIESMRILANGTISLSKNLQTNNNILFQNNQKISFSAAQGQYPNILSFGNGPNLDPLGISCISTSLNTPLLNQFSGTIQLYGNVNNNLNVLEMGFDGANSVIESTSNSGNSVNTILLNYYCGRDVKVGNSNSGDLTTNHNYYALGNIGIGINTGTSLSRKLEVNGDALLMAASSNDVNGFEFKSQGGLPTRRGISLGADPDGSMNFFINTFQNQERFNFINRDGNSSNLKYLLTITGDGNLGLGTNTPLGFQDSPLPTNLSNYKLLHLKGDDPTIRLESTNSQQNDFVITSSNGFARLISENGLAVFLSASNNQTPDNYFTIIKNHSFFENTITDDDVLFKVNGDGYIGAHGLRVTTGTFPDYVFNDDYKLMSLSELDDFLQKNKHLPGVPESSEITSNGMDMGQIVIIQMAKIEELTLYILDLQNQIDDLKNK